MDERAFKRHLRDLSHGHHHPEEHDWQGVTTARQGTPSRKQTQPKRRATPARPRKSSRA